MKIYGFFAVLCIIVIDVIDICYSKCDEYVIIMKEFTIAKHKLLKTMKLGEINWNELSYPDNSTDVFNEINGYKGCLLEFDCDGKESSCFDKIVTKNLSTHSVIPGNDTIHTYKFREKPSHVVSDKIDTSMYDVNIIYVNEYDMRNDSKTQNYIIFCDYAETVCIDDESPQNHSLSDDKDSINITSHDETTRTLQVIFNRDQTSPIQPVFTGYYSPISNDSNFSKYSLSDVPLFDEFKSVSFHCQFRGNLNNCERSNENLSIKETNKTPSINVYLKTNYVQNDTKTKYSNCTKHLNNTDSKSFNFECDGTGFSGQNPHILFTPKVNYNSSINYSNQSNSSILRTELDDLLIWYCQVMDLNYTENTTLLAGQPSNNVIYLKNCSSSKHLSNNTHSRDTQAIPENKVEILDDIITNDDEKINIIKVPNKTDALNKDFFSRDKENDNFEMHIVTDDRNNCSQNSTPSFIEGKIIDLEKDIHKGNILNYDIVELKLSNCIDDKYIIRNNTQLHHQTELDIIFSNDTTNGTLTNLLKRKCEEPYDKRHIILQCLYPGLSTENNSKVTLECEFIDIIISNTSNNTSQQNIKSIPNIKNNKSENNIKGISNASNNTSQQNIKSIPNIKNNTSENNIKGISNASNNTSQQNIKSIPNIKNNTSENNIKGISNASNNTSQQNIKSIPNIKNNTSENNIKSISNASNNTPEKNIKKEQVNIDFGVTNKNNCTTNKTEHGNKCVPRKCSSNELIECNNNFTTSDNSSDIIENKEEGNHNNDKHKAKIQTVTKTSVNTEGSRQRSLDLGSDDDFEKIMLIVILTIAGTSIMAVLMLRMCPNKQQYHPTPAREAPDEEDTAL